MPKKHNQKFLNSKTKYVHPSLGTNKESHGTSSTAAASINERLSQLRISQAPKVSPENIDRIRTAVTQRSVPPNLRAVLDLPETVVPLPRPGTRRRIPLTDPYTAGPVAPQSWLAESRHAPAGIRAQGRRYGTKKLKSRSFPFHLETLPGVNMPKKSSLLDCALIAMSRNWNFVVHYEQLNLATLPPRFKSLLPTYLSVYGPEAGIEIAGLLALFYTKHETLGGTGTQDFFRLDLTGLIWGDVSLPSLEKQMLLPQKARRQSSIGESTEEYAIVESWDQEDASIPGTLGNSPFTALTHLSFARPDPRSPSLWASLLSITSHLPKLTHLSLAYWPVPSLTPNSNTASVHGRGSPRPVQLGGTDFYSHSLDNDFSEAANILRRLSLHTICLEWIDLEGCSEWSSALTWANDQQRREDTLARPQRRSGGALDTSDWDSQACLGPDWNGPWRFVRHLNLSQGWVPTNQAVPACGKEGMQIFDSLHMRLARDDGISEAIERADNATKSELLSWVEAECRARDIKHAVQRMRTGGGLVTVDHGWDVSR